MTLPGSVDPDGTDDPDEQPAAGGAAAPDAVPANDASDLADKPVLDWTNEDWAGWIDSADGGALPVPTPGADRVEEPAPEPEPMFAAEPGPEAVEPEPAFAAEPGPEAVEPESAFAAESEPEVMAAEPEAAVAAESEPDAVEPEPAFAAEPAIPAEPEAAVAAESDPAQHGEPTPEAAVGYGPGAFDDLAELAATTADEEQDPWATLDRLHKDPGLVHPAEADDDPSGQDAWSPAGAEAPADPWAQDPEPAPAERTETPAAVDEAGQAPAAAQGDVADADDWAGVSDHPWWESAPVLAPEPVVFGDEPPTSVEASVPPPAPPSAPRAPERRVRTTRAMPAPPPAPAGVIRSQAPHEPSHRVRSAFGLLLVAMSVGVVVAGLITVVIFAISVALRHAVG
ncbi:MAG: hypothetical protein ACR2MO_17280 [Acidimicrobiales bacterium]